MKISILLPYKENFSPEYPGAVSLFIFETSKISKFKNNITVFGNTDYKKLFNFKYVNIDLKKKIFSSQTKNYVDNFIKLEKNNNSSIIEVHNRPSYIHIINNIFVKKFSPFIFIMIHYQWMDLNLSQRKQLLKSCYKLYLIVRGQKKILQGLENKFVNSNKLLVFYQSAKPGNISLIKQKNGLLS